MTPDEARAAMVGRLQAEGALTTSTVARAMINVPRHRFIEGVSVHAAYADTAVPVKHTRDGTAISSASQPAIVAAMLELSDLAPGQRVLEIGTGTGYNAALLASLVGADGRIVTVELDEDLALAARERLRQLDLAQVDLARVDVVIADGAAGYPEAAPYDRIIVTTGAPELADAWRQQVRIDGRVVVPIVNADGVGRVRCLVKVNDELVETASMACGFLPMRGDAVGGGGGSGG